jgi:hypothetical protein
MHKQTNKKMNSNGYLGFSQWLSGLIDGDGCFLISRIGYASLEITVATVDEPMLQKIQLVFGGSIKARSGSQSVRYRLHNQPGLTTLVHCVNGLIRNSIRQNQLKSILDLYTIEYKAPVDYSWDSGYACGLFDSDGSVSLSVKKHHGDANISGTLGKVDRLTKATQTQLTISITQKFKHNLAFLLILPNFDKDPKVESSLCDSHKSESNQPYAESHFGKVSYDKSQNGYFKWYVTSRSDVTKCLNYFAQYQPKSKKAHRLRLIKRYYALIDMQARDSNCARLQRMWRDFAQCWFKYSN